jgi:hypothetical protein
LLDSPLWESSGIFAEMVAHLERYWLSLVALGVILLGQEQFMALE